MNFIAWCGVLAILLLLVLFIAGSWKLEDEDIKPYDATDYSRARLAYQQSQQNFELADPQYIDIAISDLGASENRVNNELLKIRLERH